MPKFVPRQRKHKILARSSSKTHTNDSFDSNAVEHIPAAKADIEEKKQALREDLRKRESKISGKKAKRLQKYIETKLKKDENKQLIQKLASRSNDTSLYSSSRKLGQGRETKRERLERALRDQQAGIDLDDNNEEILFKKRIVHEVEHQVQDEIESQAKDRDLFLSSLDRPAQPLIVNNGGGLKRPFEFDDAGMPVLKKRRRRGGINSKLSFKNKKAAEPEWGGFRSESEMDNTTDTEASDFENGTYVSEEITFEKQLPSDSDVAKETSNEEDAEEGGSSEDSDGSNEFPIQRQRSSAFKAWANQQLNEAVGYLPGSAAPNAIDTPRVAGFHARAPEQDPLPPELQPTKNNSRKAFHVTVTRSSDMQASRIQLPVVGEEQKIMEAVHNNNLVLIHGATGSGKTTQVPQFLYEAGYGSPDSPTPGIIGVTQPRRVAAVSMAKRVGDELGDHGKKVAYQIRFEGSVSGHTAIKFMTDGVLLREVAQDIVLRKYSVIVIDEVHERSVNTDILIGMLSRVIKLREELAVEDSFIKPLKLIIMSATLRITDFTQNSTLFPEPPPVIQAEGRQYPVTVHFSRRTHHDYVEEVFRKITKGHRKLPPGGFLVFLTGQSEISHLCTKLREAFRIGYTASSPQVRISGVDAPMETEDINFGDTIDDDEDDYDDDNSDEVDVDVNDEEFDIGEESETRPRRVQVLPLYSLLPTREQLRVFEPPPNGSRLIVLATNVAETSLTIPGIRFVFDCGRSKERRYDRTTGVQSFEVGWISKASASQRAGRAGRIGPGHCYRLYSSAMFERDFREFTEPEILRMPIEGVVLQLKAMNLQHVINFPFPTPPDRQSLANSERLLTYLSAISPTGQITPMGSAMSIFPLSPRFARILLVGHVNNCLPYTIALVAGLSAADVFIPENQAIPAAVVFSKEDGDYLTNAEKIEEEARNNKERHFKKIHKMFCSTDDRSDAIKLLQVVAEFAHNPTEAWCQLHYVRFKVLKEIQQLRRQITDLLRTNIAAFAAMKYQEKLEQPTVKQVKTLKQVVAAGFLDHVAIRADLTPNSPKARRKPTRAIDVPYLTLFPSNRSDADEDGAVYIHSSSALAHLSPQECPEYVIYSYLQRASSIVPGKLSKTRMAALTDIPGGQLAALAKGTPLLYYGKPIKEVKSTLKSDFGNVRECWVIPYLRHEGSGGIGWPLPARKVAQQKIPGRGWVVE